MSGTVASQIRGRPLFQGMTVVPSECFLSDLGMPLGSKMAGMLGEARALLIKSLMAECLGCHPWILRQLRSCRP